MLCVFVKQNNGIHYRTAESAGTASEQIHRDLSQQGDLLFLPLDTAQQAGCVYIAERMCCVLWFSDDYGATGGLSGLQQRSFKNPQIVADQSKQEVVPNGDVEDAIYAQ